MERAVDVWAQRTENKSDDVADKMESYNKYIWRKWLFIIACIVATFFIIGYALTIGDYSIAFWDTYRILWEHITGNVTDEVADFVMWDLRAPRMVTGIIVGCALGATGAVMQSILRNPLADPYTTGISSGASFGATLAIGLGISITSSAYAVVANAFLFSLIPLAVIMIISKMRSTNPTTMVMAGIAVMYLFNAMNTMIRLWCDEETLSALFAWSVGSIDGAKWEYDGVMAVFAVVGLGILMVLSRRLNVLSTGDESARSIGVNPGRLRLFSLLIVSLVAAAVVSFTGLIGFIGLVCPHIARLVIGSDNRYLIPASAVFGMALILAADTVGRIVIAPAVIQVGVITSFIGAPLFLYLIVKQRKDMW